MITTSFKKISPVDPTKEEIRLLDISSNFLKVVADCYPLPDAIKQSHGVEDSICFAIANKTIHIDLPKALLAKIKTNGVIQAIWNKYAYESTN